MQCEHNFEILFIQFLYLKLITNLILIKREKLTNFAVAAVVACFSAVTNIFREDDRVHIMRIMIETGL